MNGLPSAGGPPPTDIEPKALWQKLQELPRANEVVPFPRKDFAGNPIGELRIWVLTQEEREEATAAAELYARKRLKDAKATDIGYEELYSNEVCVQILWRACRDVVDPNRAAWPTDALLRQITTEEIAVLFEHYITTQKKLGPIVAEMSPEDFDLWVKKLAEGGTQYPLNSLSSDMKNVLLLGMALRLHAQPTDKSSAGSPPEERLESDALSPSDPLPLSDDDPSADSTP